MQFQGYHERNCLWRLNAHGDHQRPRNQRVHLAVLRSSVYQFGTAMAQIRPIRTQGSDACLDQNDGRHHREEKSGHRPRRTRQKRYSAKYSRRQREGPRLNSASPHPKRDEHVHVSRLTVLGDVSDCYRAAGTDTTSYTLTCALLLLLNTPGTLEKLTAELEEVFPHNDDPITFALTQDLPYLNSVINEALRLMPSVNTGSLLCSTLSLSTCEIDDSRPYSNHVRNHHHFRVHDAPKRKSCHYNGAEY
jgi:hypothetical protein